MALYGMQQERGFQLGLEYMANGNFDDQGRPIIAGRPVEVIVKDDEVPLKKQSRLRRN
jgi:branched-chain amino acid transport system substrate-binding protein